MRRRFLALSVGVAMVLGLAGGAVEADRWDRIPALGPGDWFDPDNWQFDDGPPRLWDSAYIDNGGTAVVDPYAFGAECANLRLGEYNTGYLEQSGNSMTIGTALEVGCYSGSAGSYTLTDSTLAINTDAIIGASGYGFVSQSGGATAIGGAGGGHLVLAESEGSTGTYWLTDGDLTVEQGLRVGEGGTGLFSQEGGAVDLQAGYLLLGGLPTGHGTYEINGGSLSVGTAPDSRITIGDRGTGVFDQWDGTVQFTARATLGDGSTGNGTYNLRGGSLAIRNPNAELRVGEDGSGTFNHFDGTNQVEGELILGNQNSGQGTYNFCLGAVAVEADETVGYRGRGTFHQYGWLWESGTHSVAANFYLGREATGSGTYTLDDGLLEVGTHAYVGYRGEGFFEQTGGTCTVGADLYVGNMEGGTGTFTMSGGLAAVEGQVHVVAGSELLMNGGVLHAVGGLTNDGLIAATGGTLSANVFNYGIVLVHDSGSFIVGGEFTNADWLDLQLGSLQVGGTLAIHPLGAVEGNGTVTCADLANEGSVRSAGGDLDVQATGSATNVGILTNAVGTTLTISAQTVAQQGTVAVTAEGAVAFDGDVSNLPGADIMLLGGALAAATLTHSAGATLTGTGSITAELTNEGTTDFFGAVQIYGPVLNAPGATLAVRDGNLLITGHTTNEAGATVKVTNGQAYFEGGLTGNGEVNIDPALAVFVGDLVLGPEGFLVADAGSTVQIMGNLLSSSQRDDDWNTAEAELVAKIGREPVHNLGLTSTDFGALPVAWNDNFAWGRLTVEAGQTVDLLDAGPAGGALYLGDLVLQPGATLEQNDLNLYYDGQLANQGAVDMATGNLVAEYPDAGPSPLAQITAMLTSGQNIEAGYWDGPGIHSSAAANDPTGLTTLGVLDNAEYGWPDLEGAPVDESCVLVKYTYYGDADLDGSTTGDDYFLWLAGFDAAREALAHGGEPTLEGWLYGDFDYSGDVTGDDYFLWLVAFDAARSGATPLSGGAAAAIPEPVSLSLVGVGLVAVLARKRARTGCKR